MKCEHVQEKLPLYIRGLLDRDETNKIAEHLKECSNCKNAFNAERGIGVAIKEMFEEEFDKSGFVIPDFEQKKKKDRFISINFRRIALGLAATLLLTIGITHLFNRNKKGKTNVIEPKIETVKIQPPKIKKIVFIDREMKTRVNKLGNNIYLIQIQGGKND